MTSGLVESINRSERTSFSILPLSRSRFRWIFIQIQFACHVPQVLAGVIQIDDLDRARKMLVGEIPDPFGAVANDNLLFRTAPAPVPGFQINAFAKLFGC